MNRYEKQTFVVEGMFAAMLAVAAIACAMLNTF